MAGLAGIFDAECASDALGLLLDRMCSVMTHEPWYQTHTAVRPPLAAGRVGLGIINPQAQPARNEDGTVLTWMDGEIYDFQRPALVRQLQTNGHHIQDCGDAELVAHLYEELGEDCVRDLDGTFAVAILDQRLGRLMIAVDRSATRPLYFYACDNRFLFASEVKAILQDDRVPRQLDEYGLVEFFTFRHPLGERTLIRDVRFLPAGCLATFRDGRALVRSYWEPTVFEDQPSRRREDYLDGLAAGLRRALERQTSGDQPIGLFLSGGLDSRLLAGLMPTVQGGFHTFTRGPLESWDVKYGTMVAEKVGSQHHIIEFKPEHLRELARRGVWLTDGLMMATDIYVLSMTGVVKPCVDVVLFGLAPPDGLLGGLGLTKGLSEARSLDEVAREFVAQYGIYIPASMQAELLAMPLYQRTKGAAFETFRQMLGTYQANTLVGQMEAFAMQCRLPRSGGYGPFLARTQVETRFPYGDNDFSELIRHVPSRWRSKRQLQIALLKHVRPDLARVPWEFTGVPADISTPTRIFLQRGLYYARRRASQWTRGLVSAGSARERANYPVWFRTDLREWLEGILLDRRTLDRGYLNETYLRQMITDHMNGRQNYTTQFGLLLTFELWNRLFIDGESP